MTDSPLQVGREEAQKEPKSANDMITPFEFFYVCVLQSPTFSYLESLYNSILNLIISHLHVHYQI